MISIKKIKTILLLIVIAVVTFIIFTTPTKNKPNINPKYIVGQIVRLKASSTKYGVIISIFGPDRKNTISYEVGYFDILGNSKQGCFREFELVNDNQ